MKFKVIIAGIFSVLLLIGCGPKMIYLEGPRIGDEQPDILKACLKKAIYDINSAAPPLTDKDKTLLNGINIEYFIWWGSLSGPMPVINRQGLPSEARTAFPVLDKDKITLSQRYVLCLLENGYTWPDEDWVKERFNESN